LYFLQSGEDPVPSTERVKGVPLIFDTFSRRAKRILDKSMALLSEKRYSDAAAFRRALKSRFFGL
ncbi:MAG: serine/threonine protein kinase, partial [Mesotoga sp.]|nr:serine/threonine protein kinase [Mesotoga sp.]